jgi:hypothetical protein
VYRAFAEKRKFADGGQAGKKKLENGGITDVPKEVEDLIKDEDSHVTIEKSKNISSNQWEVTLKKEEFSVIQEYNDNTGDPIGKYQAESLEDAKRELSGLTSPDEWKSKYSDHFAYIAKVISKAVVVYEKNEEGDWSLVSSPKWQIIDQEDTGIVKSFGTREMGADYLLTDASLKLREDLNGEYEVNDKVVKVTGKDTGKYGSLYLNDKDGNQFGVIEVRIADHSYNPRNRGNEEGFISVVIANEDETQNKFHGIHDLHFNARDNYIDVVQSVKDKLQEIMEGMDIDEMIGEA